ncbi:Peptidyl-prolyl cis-trans isomerase E-like protein [Hapsidospora chrysogenum ATCC 11550]|uniref:Peptidyl-prolyl cis-trans isomerase E-like protein n=1 Tax=Hapsidospora chrysogenum (strain ATCC 11550 / CBS 779.69 / DSM 880 / IAM 14645 / JCM 23072 / IMI 49137) TaxID=857340 RepID=A0A086TH08_HAPC1|nr:Peptidyl-prolyl cis-trans isomerase E-like protein [Hapsidospora chrysogenum ATCC 11550]
MTDSTRWKATVYVGGLPPNATTSHVLDAFIPFGEIVEVQVPKNNAPNSTEPHRGFAYVEFEDSADAKEAIDNMNQAEFFGKILKVSPAKAPKSADEGLGSKTAVWEQEGWLAKHAAEEENGDGDQAQTMNGSAPDPMQGLEGLDVAGPRPQ